MMVAAGGGGDAIAAAVLANAVPGIEGVGIATLAWDRLIVDPLPGPRSVSDFTCEASATSKVRRKYVVTNLLPLFPPKETFVASSPSP